MAMYAMFNSFLRVYQRVMTWFCERFGWSPRGPFMTSTTSPSGCFWGMWCPPVINWLIIPMNTIDYRYITFFNHSYWSYLHQLSYRTGAPPCTILFVQSQTYIYIYVLHMAHPGSCTVPPSNTSEPKGCCKHPRYRGKLGKDWVNIEMYPLVN